MVTIPVTFGQEKIIVRIAAEALDVSGDPWLNVTVETNQPAAGMNMVRTTTTAERNQNALNEAYVDAHALVIHYLDEIRARIHDMPAPETEGLHWAHVGDMNKIKNDLREVVDFLNGYQQ